MSATEGYHVFQMLLYMGRCLKHKKQLALLFAFTDEAISPEVRAGRFELPHPKAPPPQDGVSTSFTTCAGKMWLQK